MLERVRASRQRGCANRLFRSGFVSFEFQHTSKLHSRCTTESVLRSLHSQPSPFPRPKKCSSPNHAPPQKQPPSASMGWFSRATDQDGDEDSLADESIQNLLGFVDCRYQDEDGAKFREDVISRVINRLWLTGQDSLEKAAAPNCRFWVCPRSRFCCYSHPFPQLEQILPKSIKIHDFIVTAGERSPQVSNAIFEESLEDISERMEAVIDLEMWYGGNMNVYIVLGTEEDDPKDNLEIVVTNIQCTCKIRGVFKPPVDFLSCFAACEVSMKDAPLITFQVTRLNDSKLMSVPDVEKILKEAVWECLYDTMIYPRSFSIPILPHMEMERTVLRPPGKCVNDNRRASHLQSPRRPRSRPHPQSILPRIPFPLLL